jgi:hypothetical protein
LAQRDYPLFAYQLHTARHHPVDRREAAVKHIVIDMIIATFIALILTALLMPFAFAWQ